MAEAPNNPLVGTAHTDRGTVPVTGQNFGQQTFSTTYSTVLPPNALPPLPSNVPAPPRHYVARPELLEKLRQTLFGDGTAYVNGQAVASGDGGQGKTVLSQAYAHHFANDYPGGRFCISCETGSLATALAGLIPPGEDVKGLTEDQRGALVRTWLAREPRTLLILDNVTDDDQWCRPEFKAMLPGPPCHLLITTRAEHLSGVRAIPVGRLSESEAIDLLERFRPSAKDPQHLPAVQRILADIEHLAATVAAVGAVMELDDDDDWEAYAQRLAASPVEQFPDQSEAARRETGYAGKTVVVLDDLRRRLPPAELRVLDYASLLPADQIVPIWLEFLLGADADPSRGDARLDLGKKPSGKPRTPADVLQHLRKLDLLRPTAESGITLSVHRLHRRRATELLAQTPDQRNSLLNAIAAVAGSRGPASHAALTDPILRPELTPLSALVHALADAGRPDAALRLANWLNTPLRGLARYAEGRRNLERFVGRDPTTGPDTDSTEHAAGLSNLALILHDLGDLRAARARLERAIDIEDQHFDPDHPNLAISHSNLAMILKDLGDLPGARDRMERAIAIDEKHFDSDDPNLATRHSNLALILHALGDLRGARDRLEQAIAINEKNFDPDHPDFAIRYSNLALILLDLGDLPEARDRVERAIAIWGTHFDPDHPNLGFGYNNLAFIEANAGDFAKAVSAMTSAVAIRQTHYSSDHFLRRASEQSLAAFTHFAALPKEEARHEFAKWMGKAG